MTEDSLRCSLTDLISTFRSGLLALIPTADRLLLEWRYGREHRDWERLAATLFDVCVRGPVSSDSSRREGEHPLPPYDIDVDSYATFSWITLAGKTTDPPRAFIRLMTDLRPFDTVQFAILNPSSLVPIERAVLPVDEARFAFRRRSSGHRDIEVHEVKAID